MNVPLRALSASPFTTPSVGPAGHVDSKGAHGSVHGRINVVTILCSTRGFDDSEYALKKILTRN
jgi:hypothetical protein